DGMCFFFETPDVVELERLGFIFVVDGTESMDQLDMFKTYGEGLSAPNGYFGENWNAFLDCVCDLQWMKAHEVFIVHHELPRLSCEDTAIYLDILRNAVETWADEKTDELSRIYPDFVPHRLTIFFPGELKSVISAYLQRGR